MNRYTMKQTDMNDYTHESIR